MRTLPITARHDARFTHPTAAEAPRVLLADEESRA